MKTRRYLAILLCLAMLATLGVTVSAETAEGDSFHTSAIAAPDDIVPGSEVLGNEPSPDLGDIDDRTCGDALDSHRWGRSDFDIPATCTTPAMTVQRIYCVNCGYIMSEWCISRGDKAEHDWETKTITESCVAGGSAQVRVCRVCGYTEELPGAGTAEHSWGSVSVQKCGKGSYTFDRCIRCGLTRNYQYKTSYGHVYDGTKKQLVQEAKCGVVGNVYLEACECGEAHRYLSDPVTPHEWVEGEDGEYCSLCGAKKHEHEWYDVVDKKATCTETGVKHQQCRTCAAQSAPQQIPMLPHSYTGIEVTQPATCTEAGLQVKICDVCGARSEAEEIPALGHALKLKSDGAQHWLACVRTGCDHAEQAEAHTPVAGDCTRANICATCGAKIDGLTASDKHEWTWQWAADPERAGHCAIGTCKHPGCEVRGSEVWEPHTFYTPNGDCRNGQYCSICGFLRPNTQTSKHLPLKDTYKYNEEEHWPACAYTGCDGDKEHAAPHEWTLTATKDASFDAPGEKTYSCVCGATRTEVIPQWTPAPVEPTLPPVAEETEQPSAKPTEKPTEPSVTEPEAKPTEPSQTKPEAKPTEPTETKPETKPTAPTEESKPAAPQQPVQPQQPAEPDAPDEPETPEQPAEPDAPDEPETSEQPAEPDVPDEPETPEQPAEPQAPAEQEQQPAPEKRPATEQQKPAAEPVQAPAAVVEEKIETVEVVAAPAVAAPAAIPEVWKPIAEKLTFTEVAAVEVAANAPVREVVVRQAEIHDEYDAYLALTVEMKPVAANAVEGKVRMSMPVDIEAETFKLVRVEEDGTLTEIEFTYEDGILSFDAEDASLYLLVPVE